MHVGFGQKVVCYILEFVQVLFNRTLILKSGLEDYKHLFFVKFLINFLGTFSYIRHYYNDTNRKTIYLSIKTNIYLVKLVALNS